MLSTKILLKMIQADGGIISASQEPFLHTSILEKAGKPKGKSVTIKLPDPKLHPHLLKEKKAKDI
jgi:hypothetical protein